MSDEKPLPGKVAVATEPLKTLMLTLYYTLYQVKDLDMGHLRGDAVVGDPNPTFTYRSRLNDQLTELLKHLDRKTLEALGFVWRCPKCGSETGWQTLCDKAYEWRECDDCNHREKIPGENPGWDQCECEHCEKDRGSSS